MRHHATSLFALFRGLVYAVAFLGGVLVLLPASILALLVFLVAFAVIAHLFVRLSEEPTLGRAFGAQYDAYRGRVHRWLPGSPRG